MFSNPECPAPQNIDRREQDPSSYTALCTLWPFGRNHGSVVDRALYSKSLNPLQEVSLQLNGLEISNCRCPSHTRLTPLSLPRWLLLPAWWLCCDLPQFPPASYPAANRASGSVALDDDLFFSSSCKWTLASRSQILALLASEGCWCCLANLSFPLLFFLSVVKKEGSSTGRFSVNNVLLLWLLLNSTFEWWRSFAAAPDWVLSTFICIEENSEQL